MPVVIPRTIPAEDLARIEEIVGIARGHEMSVEKLWRSDDLDWILRVTVEYEKIVGGANDRLVLVGQRATAVCVNSRGSEAEFVRLEDGTWTQVRWQLT